MKPLLVVLAGCTLAATSTVTNAVSAIELVPHSRSSGVFWQGEGVAITYESNCYVNDSNIIPSAECGWRLMDIQSQLLVEDRSHLNSGPRHVELEDLMVLVDGAKVSTRSSHSFRTDFRRAVQESNKKLVQISVPRVVGSWDLPEPHVNLRTFEYVLSDFDKATQEYMSTALMTAQKQARKLAFIRLGGALVGLLAIILLMRWLTPVVKRWCRSLAKFLSRMMRAASEANYNRKLNRKIEEMRLQEEAEKRRRSERKQEPL